jgi:hypothetical protein
MLGWLKGIISALILSNVYNLILCKFFNLEPFEVADLNFIAWEPERQYNIGNAFVLEGNVREKFKQTFINNGIKHFRKLRQKPVNLLGSYYWNLCSENEAIKQIIDIDHKFDKDEDIDLFLSKLTHNPFTKNELQWRLYIAENNNKTTVIINWDHSLCDGLGLMSLIFKLTDCFDIKNYPPLKKKTNSEKIFNLCMIPIFTLYVLYKLFFIRSGRGPFKSDKRTIDKQLVSSKSIPFTPIRNVTKKLNVTFNDYILNVITNASKRYLKENNYDQVNSISCLIPVNFRETPKTEEELVLNIKASGTGIKIHFNNDNIKQLADIKKTTDICLKKHLFAETTHFLNTLINQYLPFILSRELIKGSAKHFDFVVSNVPGSNEPFYICGSKVTKFMAFPCPGPHSCFIGIITYMNEMKIYYAQDSSVGCNAVEFVKVLESEIDISINILKAN